jgi:hypothetical protein
MAGRACLFSECSEPVASGGGSFRRLRWRSHAGPQHGQMRTRQEQSQAESVEPFSFALEARKSWLTSAMEIGLSDVACQVTDAALGAGGKRGAPSRIPAHVLFVAAAIMAKAGKPWRDLDSAAGDRFTAARRVRRWVESGALERLKADLTDERRPALVEAEALIDMIDCIRHLPGRPRSVKGRGWTQRKPRNPRKPKGKPRDGTSLA